jgi:hypothetical protein
VIYFLEDFITDKTFLEDDIMKSTSELMLKNEVTDVNSPFSTNLPLEFDHNNMNSGI